MILKTITVLTFLILFALCYCVYYWRKKALDFKIKYFSTRTFADESAKQILNLQENIRMLNVEKDDLALTLIKHLDNTYKVEEEECKEKNKVSKKNTENS